MDEHFILNLTIDANNVFARLNVFIFPFTLLEPVFINNQLVTRVEAKTMINL